MTWVVILTVGAGSFVFRLGPLLFFRRSSLGAGGDRVVRNAGIAAITALVVVATKQHATGRATVPTLLAMTLAVVLVARGASMLRLLVWGGALYAGTIIAAGVIAR